VLEGKQNKLSFQTGGTSVTTRLRGAKFLSQDKTSGLNFVYILPVEDVMF